MANFNDVMAMASDMPTKIDDGSEVDYASDGTPIIWRHYGKTWLTFDISFTGLTVAQWTALNNFYVTNKSDAAISFTDPSSLINYSVRMMAPPQIARQYNTYYDATIQLIGKAA